jgi:hypothetical protein
LRYLANVLDAVLKDLDMAIDFISLLFWHLSAFGLELI